MKVDLRDQSGNAEAVLLVAAAVGIEDDSFYGVVADARGESFMRGQSHFAVVGFGESFTIALPADEAFETEAIGRDRVLEDQTASTRCGTD